MTSVYGRVVKISNAVGRADYITDEKRQEEIVLHKENMLHSWEEHSSFEKEHQKSNSANNEALEVHIALPNELAHDTKELSKICDELVNEIVGENKDYEYAVHWNHNRTNLHVHILFSEREYQIDLEPKVYKKDIWQDKDTHKLAKANSENAVLVHKKGEIQKDKDGNIKYQTDIFKAKDKRFIQKSFVHEKNKIVEKIMKSHGYNLEYQDKESPYLAQKKLYKGSSPDYLEKAKMWNAEVQRYNEGVKRHIEIEPLQKNNYRAIKKEILDNVKEANAEEKKITPRAIEFVKNMGNWVHETLLQLEVFARRKARGIETMEKWEQVKDKFVDIFYENERIEEELKGLRMELTKYNNTNFKFNEVIQSKKALINDIEDYEKYEKNLAGQLKELEPRAYQNFTKEEYLNEIKGLSYEERIEKAENMIENLERNNHEFKR